MNHKISLDYIIFWSSLLTVLVISHKADGILTGVSLFMKKYQIKLNPEELTAGKITFISSKMARMETQRAQQVTNGQYYSLRIVKNFIKTVAKRDEVFLRLKLIYPRLSESKIKEDSNDIHCTQIQCPKKCPEDSYLKAALDDEEENFEDYEDELLGHDPYIEEIGHFGDIPPVEELYDVHAPQHMLKERQKREVFFQEDIERCCDDQKCVCNKCPDVPKCTEGYMAVEIVEGQGVPGNCCSIFRCVKKETCQLGVKQSWWTTNCRKCSCFGENELCMQICPEEEILQNCYSEYWQKPMMNGAVWKEGSCTSCSCEQGERRCFTPVCPKLDCKETIRLEDACCPKCIDDEIDVRTEIEQNKQQDFDKADEENSTDSTTIENAIVKINEEHNSNVSQSYGSSPIVNGNAVKEAQTTAPFMEVKDSSPSSVILKSANEISVTFQPETDESATATTSSLPTSSTLSPSLENSSTAATYREEPESEIQQEHDSITPVNSTTTITTQNPKSTIEKELDSSTTPTSTEEPKYILMLEQDFSSTEKVQITSTLTTATSEKFTTEETTTTDYGTMNSSLENSTPTSTTYMENTTNSDATRISTTASTTDTPIELTTTIIADSSTEVNDVYTTNDPTDIPVTTSIILSTSAPSTTSTSTESTKTHIISSSTHPKTAHPTNTPPESTSTPTSAASSTSTEYSTTSSTTFIPSTTSTTSSTTFIPSTTSTTSSPYSTRSDFTTTSDSEKSTSTSTTISPEPRRPLFQSYEDFNTDDGNSSTQNQMRIMFDEIDYVVMIVLFIGSLLCISLGLIIRHTKNRKKMYSSIPNSETSLSQTSTNTVMTV